MRARNEPPSKAMLLGLGLDNEDGHTRLTRGPNFVLAGGSQETHSEMQQVAVKLNEQLKKKGKRLEDTSAKELRDMIDDARR